MKQLCNRVAALAWDKAKVRNFVALFGEYCKTLSRLAGNTTDGTNQTDFTGQEIALWCGSWSADDTGITNTNRFGEVIEACSHPVYPLRLLTNIDTGLEKIELHWRRGNDPERSHIFQKSTVANANSIVKLSDYGVAVNSENAKYLVKFLHDVESLNYDRLERSNSVGRLGWIEGYGFSPYIENLVFDGEDSFSERFDSIRQNGNKEKWMDLIKSLRKNEHPIFRIIFAASLASCLVKPSGIKPFVVHLWGRGGTGKTVILMVAASIWGNPEIGRYIKTFNSTAVARELECTFLNSMPLMLDELQIAARERDKMRQMVYELTEGAGRSRGTKEVKSRPTGKWSNCTITTGEQPIRENDWTEGAKYRTIEVKCSDIRFFESDRNILKSAKEIVSFILKNHGFLGREFVAKLEEVGVESFKPLHDEITAEIMRTGNYDNKQALSAALILVADTLAEQWIFKDSIRLTVQDILPHLITRHEADQDRKAFEYLQEAASIYRVHFDPELAESKITEVWGEFKTARDGREYVVFYPSRFNQLLEDKGYNAGKFIEWARENGMLRLSKDGKSTLPTKVGGAKSPQRCYWLLMPNANEMAKEDEENEQELDYL